MKTKLTLLLSLLVFSSFSFSQSNSYFEDINLEGWTNTDGSITNLTIEETGLPNNYNQHMLQKECDGSNSAVGEMAIINVTEDWIGTYPIGFYDAFAGLEVYVKNDNNFNLYFRVGYRGGSDNTKMVTTDSYVVAAFSDWSWIYIDTYLGGFTIVEGGNSEEEVFADSHEARIIHNDEISFDGKQVDGSLKISWISSVFLLSNSEQLKAETKLFPNPVNDKVILTLPFEAEGDFELYNVIGEKVLNKNFFSMTTQIDLSGLKSGVYLVRIQTENQSTIKKIVKL